MEKPIVFDYVNYRKFFHDTYLYLKSIDKKYSHRYITQKVSASSNGWLADIISGRINITPTFVIRIAKLFGLKQREQNFLENIIGYAHAGSIDEREMYLQKIMSCKEIKTSIILKDQFKFYSTWYIPAIREHLFKYNFTNDYAELANKLNPKITIAEAKKAIKILVATKLIKKTSNGFYKPIDPVIKKDNNFKSIYWYLYMKSNINLSLEALSRFPKREERNISAVTMMLSEEGLQKASECIDGLRKELLKISEEDRKKDKVYQCNIQLFPLTK